MKIIPGFLRRIKWLNRRKGPSDRRKGSFAVRIDKRTGLVNDLGYSIFRGKKVLPKEGIGESRSRRRPEPEKGLRIKSSETLKEGPAIETRLIRTDRRRPQKKKT